MIHKDKIVFIVNPKSGKNSKTRIEELIHKNLDAEKWNAEVVRTKYASHASSLVFEFVEQGFQHIVAVGGDGTVNEIATSVFRCGVKLGIVPCGSGNGLARFLKIPMKKADAIKLLNKKQYKEIDVGSINDKFFFCTCGTGFDAKIGFKFAKNEKRGFYQYVKTILKEFRKYRPKNYKLTIDNNKIKRKALLVTVANAGQFGNNAFIAPKAQIDDGFFDISILRPFPRYKALLLSVKLFSGNIDRSRYFERFSGHTIVFHKKKKYKFHVDGEPVKLDGPVKIDIIPSALKVLVR
jgi:YegS/Rv2252/BmrU family lipid kinase